MNTSINNIIICNEPHANLDTYYGPYSSLQEALDTLNTETVAGVTSTKRAVGLSVGILENGEVVEYWFKAGTADTDLVKKISDTSIPEGVKVVTFNKNGGQGVQNSLLTDTEGNVILPQPTITRNGFVFSNWTYNGGNYNPGQTVKIMTSAVIGVEWVPGFSVSFHTGTNVNSITATANGVPFISGSSFVTGTNVVLTADVPSGYDITWTNAPTGATQSGNTLSFVVRSSNIDVTANAHQQQITYIVKWDERIENVLITGTYTENGGGRTSPIVNGSSYASGGTVVLTAKADEGFGISSWTGIPNGATKENVGTNESTLRFELTSNADTIMVNVSRLCTVLWEEPRKFGEISSATCTYGSDTINISSGSSYASGGMVALTVRTDSDYLVTDWMNKPTGATVSVDKKTLSFELNRNIEEAILPVIVRGYSVDWIDPNHATVNGTYTYNGRTETLNKGGYYPASSYVALTATPDSGYIVTGWVTPSTTIPGDRLEFTLNDNTRVEVNVREANKYIVSFVKGDGIENIIGKVDGEEFETGEPITEGSFIEITAEPTEEGFNVEWENRPQDSVISEDTKTLSFTLTGDVDVTAVASLPLTFYYCGCKDDPNYFDNLDDLQPGYGDIAVYTNDNSKVLYVIAKEGFKPTSDVGGEFKPLNESDIEGIEGAIAKLSDFGWYNQETNQTANELARMIEGYIYVLNIEEFPGSDITIILTNE